MGRNAVDVTYRDEAGRTDSVLLDRDREPGLAVEGASRAFAFDGDGDDFKLAFEALRISRAAEVRPDDRPLDVRHASAPPPDQGGLRGAAAPQPLALPAG